MLNDALNGKILNVRLSEGTVEPEEIPEETYRAYLGGYGLGARLLFDRVPQGADPLGPDNVLGFFPGLLTGTPLFGIRYQVVTKSPKNNGWGDANCGGDFGPFLKHAGWDGLMLYGQAEKPVYILIQDDQVEIKDAIDLWGMLAIDVEMALKERHGKKASVACIGPAGEHLSLMAGICNERGRLAARSGVGAVMGSKRV
ncbi:MAG: aldehyde ferredoxin oxidoreductase, partial [Chloroflexi bacterium]|nr:aldehyde ferredoxin oxidoreductase [Chloroflexota bacterium]